MSRDKRDRIVDVVRGFAIIMVMGGHVLTNNGNGFEVTKIYNIIWSLQMPLFMVISGYVRKFSQQVKNVSDYSFIIRKKTISYILPWFVWTCLVRGVLINGSLKEIGCNLIYTFNHMDSGYWFLFALWGINILYITGSLISSRCVKDDAFIAKLAPVLFTGLLLVLLMPIIFIKGPSFLGVKYIVYYLPFYCIGTIIGKIDFSNKDVLWEKICSYLFVVFLVLYIFLISHLKLFYLGDTVKGILIRTITSLVGCYVVVYFFSKIKYKFKLLELVGRYSLELYLTHYLFHPILNTNGEILVLSLEWIMYVMFNFLLMVSMSGIFIWVVSSNTYSRFLFYGKKSYTKIE